MRAAAAEQARERVVAIGTVPGGDERVGNRRTADAAAALGRGGEQRLDIERVAELAEPRADLADAADPVGSLRGQERGRARR